jgi:hypothetical protein
VVHSYKVARISANPLRAYLGVQRSSSLVASSPCNFVRLRIGEDRWDDLAVTLDKVRHNGFGTFESIVISNKVVVAPSRIIERRAGIIHAHSSKERWSGLCGFLVSEVQCSTRLMPPGSHSTTHVCSTGSKHSWDFTLETEFGFFHTIKRSCATG